MGHVFFRGRQPRAAVIVGIFFSFFALAGSAWAATATSPGGGAATCSNDPLTGAGSCSFSGNGTGSFSGKFETPATNPDPIACANQTLDPTDTLCGHFGLNFNNVTGTVTVTLTGFDSIRADLDLCIIDATGTVVGCSATFNGTEQITFTVACGDTHFEALIVPSGFDMTNEPTPLNPVTYTGNVTTSLTTCTGGGNTTGGGGKSAAGQHKVNGGGHTGFATTVTAGFSLIAMQTTLGFKGKLQISDATGCMFRATDIRAVAWDDTDQQATISGFGYFKNTPNNLLAFTATADDNGEGSSSSGPDNFTIDKCAGGGQVVDGNVQYHFGS
jgi:hypothetical protein